MRSRIWFVALLALAIAAYFIIDRQSGYARQDLPPQPEYHQFRGVVGLKDSEPRRWQSRMVRKLKCAAGMKFADYQ